MCLQCQMPHDIRRKVDSLSSSAAPKPAGPGEQTARALAVALERVLDLDRRLYAALADARTCPPDRP
jgi:hypothetical protein